MISRWGRQVAGLFFLSRHSLFWITDTFFPAPHNGSKHIGRYSTTDRRQHLKYTLRFGGGVDFPATMFGNSKSRWRSDYSRIWKERLLGFFFSFNG